MGGASAGVKHVIKRARQPQRLLGLGGGRQAHPECAAGQCAGAMGPPLAGVPPGRSDVSVRHLRGHCADAALMASRPRPEKLFLDGLGFRRIAALAALFYLHCDEFSVLRQHTWCAQQNFEAYQSSMA